MNENYGELAKVDYKYFSPQNVAISTSFLVMAVVAFAAYFDGAYFIGPMTLCVFASWALFLILVFTRYHQEYFFWWPANLVPICFMGGLWLWVGLSIMWSISSDLTWVEFNRTGGYLAIFVFGILLGEQKKARIWAAGLFVCVATLIAVYSLGVKVLPSVVDNLDDASRIAVPIGYANALGLLVALAIPISIYIATSKIFYWSVRSLSVISATVLFICLFFTASRGATFALAVGLIVYFIAAPLRLRSFGVFVLAFIPTLFIALWSTGQAALMQDHIEISERVVAASALRQYIVFALIAETSVFLIALFIGKRIQIPPIWTRFSGAIILLALVVLISMWSFLFFSSKSSISDWAHQAYNEFTTSDPSQRAGVGRLTEIGSSSRWPLWHEAIADWEDNPVKGSGAQSFPLVHLMRRETGNIFVKQAHGLGFSLLAELGIVGFVLGMAFITSSLTLASQAICNLRDRWDKGLAAALLSLSIIYLIHTSYDWDWNIYALTMVYFLFTGILLGWPGSRRSPETVASKIP